MSPEPSVPPHGASVPGDEASWEEYTEMHREEKFLDSVGPGGCHAGSHHSGRLQF